MASLVDRLRAVYSRGGPNTCREAAERIEKLEGALREYLAEYDNPVPDGLVRRLLRDKLRNTLGK